MTAKSTLIRTGWEEYRRSVMPQNAGQVQVMECRRAFYAGAMTMFVLMEKFADLEEDEAMAMLQLTKDELMDFRNNVGRGL